MMYLLKLFGNRDEVRESSRISKIGLERLCPVLLLQGTEARFAILQLRAVHLIHTLCRKNPEWHISACGS
jgi:hypothetical protein